MKQFMRLLHQSQLLQTFLPHGMWSSRLMLYIPALKNYSRHHSFRFQKGKGEYAEHVEMCYRNWSKCKRKEWLPNETGDIICTLNLEPKGSPSILWPEYNKCPSIDDMRSGLQQFSSRLSVDESTGRGNNACLGNDVLMKNFKQLENLFHLKIWYIDKLRLTWNWCPTRLLLRE
jgi:hypothetical protein